MTPELHVPRCGKLCNGYLKEKFLDSLKKLLLAVKVNLVTENENFMFFIFSYMHILFYDHTEKNFFSHFYDCEV